MRGSLPGNFTRTAVDRHVLFHRLLRLTFRAVGILLSPAPDRTLLLRHHQVTHPHWDIFVVLKCVLPALRPDISSIVQAYVATLRLSEQCVKFAPDKAKTNRRIRELPCSLSPWAEGPPFLSLEQSVPRAAPGTIPKNISKRYKCVPPGSKTRFGVASEPLRWPRIVNPEIPRPPPCVAQKLCRAGPGRGGGWIRRRTGTTGRNQSAATPSRLRCGSYAGQAGVGWMFFLGSGGVALRNPRLNCWRPSGMNAFVATFAELEMYPRNRPIKQTTPIRGRGRRIGVGDITGDLQQGGTRLSECVTVIGLPVRGCPGARPGSRRWFRGGPAPSRRRVGRRFPRCHRASASPGRICPPGFHTWRPVGTRGS